MSQPMSPHAAQNFFHSHPGACARAQCAGSSRIRPLFLLQDCISVATPSLTPAASTNVAATRLGNPSHSYPGACAPGSMRCRRCAAGSGQDSPDCSTALFRFELRPRLLRHTRILPSKGGTFIFYRGHLWVYKATHDKLGVWAKLNSG